MMQIILDTLEQELRAKTENLLEEFYSHRLLQGDSERRAKQHLSQVELFAIKYFVHHYLQDIAFVTPEHIDDFAGLWYKQKTIAPSEEELFSLLESLGCFFDYLRQENLITRDNYARLTETCLNGDEFIECFRQGQNHADEMVSASSLTELPLDTQPPHDYPEEDLPSHQYDFNDSSPTFRKMIKAWHNFPEPRVGNVISINPNADASSKTMFETTKTRETLEYRCIELMRSNLVFIRWLDRFGFDPHQMPRSTFEFGARVDNWLEQLFACILRESLSRQDILNGHEVLEQIERSLWNARQGIARQLGLDLRQLLL